MMMMMMAMMMMMEMMMILMMAMMMMKKQPNLNGDSLIVLVHGLRHVDFKGAIGLAFGTGSRLNLG